MKDKNILITILCVFLFISKFGSLITKNDFLFAEYGLIENLQVLFLFLTISSLIKYRKKLIFTFKSYFLFKTFFLIFLLYEELSHLTWYITSKNPFLWNGQNEFNLHNLDILVEDIFPSFTFVKDSSLVFLAISLVVTLIGISCFFNIPEKLRFLFVEKKYSIYILQFPLNIIFSNLFYLFNLMDEGNPIIINELSELLFYLALWFDNNHKLNKIINNYN